MSVSESSPVVPSISRLPSKLPNPALTVVTSWTQLSPNVSGAVCVLDVLRWSSAVVTALANGAQRVEAFAEPAEALARAAALGRSAIAVGERNAHALPGFSLGNSPREYTTEAVRGKVLCSSTTNGTRALLAAGGAQQVLVGSFLNFGATAGAVAALMSQRLPVTLLAAGQDGHEALEDTACAGAFVDWLVLAPMVAERDLQDSARRARDTWVQHARSPERVFAAAPHANALARAGYEQDLRDAAQLNTTAIVVEARGNVVQPATQLKVHR